jgi:hypothetical protein
MVPIQTSLLIYKSLRSTLVLSLPAPSMNSIHKGVRSLLGTIKLNAVHHDPACSVSPVNTQFQTSYDLGLDCIAVPGAFSTMFVTDPDDHPSLDIASPPLWTPPTQGLPIVLPLDVPSPSPPMTHPAWTLDPMFRAMDYTCPQLNLKEFDLITDRKNLRALLEFVQNGSAGHRIDAELVGDRTLVFFVGWRGGQGYSSAGGYGKNFERAFTSGHLEGTTQHNRVVTYTLGSVSLMIKYEVDAYLGSAEPSTSTIPPHNPCVRPSIVGPTGFRIIPFGAALAPPESILELKTVRTGKGSYIQKALAQMWFSRTPILVTGCHDGEGTFTKVNTKNVMEDGLLDDWEVRHREHLQKLLKLVEMIKEHLMASPIKRQAVVLTKYPKKSGQPVVQFYSLMNSYKLALPSDLRKKWLR